MVRLHVSLRPWWSTDRQAYRKAVGHSPLGQAKGARRKAPYVRSYTPNCVSGVDRSRGTRCGVRRLCRSSVAFLKHPFGQDLGYFRGAEAGRDDAAFYAGEAVPARDPCGLQDSVPGICDPAQPAPRSGEGVHRSAVTAWHGCIFNMPIHVYSRWPDVQCTE